MMPATIDKPASPYRLAITIVSALIGGPLALIVWFWLSGSQRARYWQSNWIRAGIAVIVIGALPLLLTILAADLHLLADPNPNPVGFGVLFFFAVLLGSVVVIAGIVRTERSSDD
jgi:hypothetical protein